MGRRVALLGAQSITTVLKIISFASGRACHHTSKAMRWLIRSTALGSSATGRVTTSTRSRESSMPSSTMRTGSDTTSNASVEITSTGSRRLRKTRPEWGPVIGDCLHNAASALDHLAYQLAILHTGTLPPDVARDTHFPIYGTPREFWDNLQKLRGIGPDQVAPLERLQPYYGRHGADNDSLMILKRLSIFGKRRTLRTTGYRFGGTYRYDPDSLIDSAFPEGRLELGAELARFTFDPPDPEMDVEPSFVVRIAFRDTPLADGVGAWAMLNAICTRSS